MLDPKFSINIEQEKPGFARLIIEPLRQGYAHTLGNALRRVLLTSLPGTAVTSIKVKGVKHQFSTLKGMSEDIVQLVLNIKNIRVQVEGTDSVILKLEAKGPGQVTAGDIHAPVGVTIANPDLVLANLADKNSIIDMELTVEHGEGYSLAEERKSNTIGVIPIDALFSPVKRVNPAVSSTRVGRRTDFDKLILDVWTDGTINARDALNKATEILVEHFQQILNPEVAPADTQTTTDAKYPNETLKLTVEELDLPTRIANALRKGGYKTVGDLIEANREDIVKVKNLGERSVSLVENALILKGVSMNLNTQE